MRLIDQYRETIASGSDETARSKQIDGDHYKKLPIQPMDYSMANGLDACQHSVVKYVTRFRDKGGVRDLEKAKHILDMLIEYENDKEKGWEQAPRAQHDGERLTHP